MRALQPSPRRHRHRGSGAAALRHARGRGRYVIVRRFDLLRRPRRRCSRRRLRQAWRRSRTSPARCASACASSPSLSGTSAATARSSRGSSELACRATRPCTSIRSPPRPAAASSARPRRDGMSYSVGQVTHPDQGDRHLLRQGPQSRPALATPRRCSWPSKPENIPERHAHRDGLQAVHHHHGRQRQPRRAQGRVHRDVVRPAHHHHRQRHILQLARGALPDRAAQRVGRQLPRHRAGALGRGGRRRRWRQPALGARSTHGIFKIPGGGGQRRARPIPRWR